MPRILVLYYSTYGHIETMAGAIAGARLGVAALPGALIARLTDRGEWDGAALIGLAARCAGTVGPSRGSADAGVIVAEPTRT